MNNSSISSTTPKYSFWKALLLSMSLGMLPLCSFAKPSNVENLIAKPAPAKAAPEKAGEKNDKTDKATDKAPDKSAAATKEAVKPEPIIENVVSVTPEELVAKPHDFLGKNVKFNANFFAFSNLALDYKPAYRPSKTHLSFLVLRAKSHVPLAELKLALMIPKEKDPDTQLLATLKDGEALEIIGKVFSAALDDPWVEVLKIKKLHPDKKEDKKADASGAEKGKAAADTKTVADPKSDKTNVPAKPKN